MISSSKFKAVDFYRKIPRDLTEASVSGAWLSIAAALAMIFLLGMELNKYLTVSTSTSIIIDNSSDGDFLRIGFNISFPALLCEFASVDVSDALGTNRFNITKTIRKFSIDPQLRHKAIEFHSEPVPHVSQHGDEVDDEAVEGSVSLNSDSFAKLSTMYDPDKDGCIILAKVNCNEAADLCKRHHVQGYPSIRIFRNGSDLRDDDGHHEHESYYGDRDTDALVKAMEELVSPTPLANQKLALEKNRAAPLTGGCRIEGYVRVKKVPGNLIISSRSGAHSFDSSHMNMSHVIGHLSFGKIISPQVLSDVKRLIPYLGRSHDKLNGRSFINHLDLDANVTIEHYLQAVKTEVVTVKSSHETHSSLAQSVNMPVAKFHFELSPMQVLITENPKSLSHFLTNVCATIGGVFTVAGILDSILYNTIRLMKKMEIGKNI
ncbi:hypothetical protein ES332_D08G028200v1 [Gossypium tomentosum]|uniref:Thioredoxin domain-containing protein n=1 Tax=Gossypium tomentosum TaxID=34277 RepID=A0A5D2JRC0_GOSTO|nr:hypothetical protein ES332_D08G028200v1 [Gossypium tomentosum]